jgi:hypothetical protein
VQATNQCYDGMPTGLSAAAQTCSIFATFRLLTEKFGQTKLRKLISVIPVFQIITFKFRNNFKNRELDREIPKFGFCHYII